MYYFELMSTFLFLLLFGALFSPVLGGCFIIFLIFFLLTGFVVFFSLNFVWFLLAGIIIYAGGFAIKFWRWHQLPDINDYLNTYPNCKLPVGVACHKCGSDKLLNQGLLQNKSKWRFYVCNSCGSMLFRFKVL